MKSKLAVLAAALAVLVAAVAVHATPVQQFSFQLKNVKPDGRFTLLFLSRTFDTTGGVPPSPLQSYLRLPGGATLRKQFLNRRYYCDGRLLRNSLDAHKTAAGTPFADRVANLKPFIKRLSRSKRKRDRVALRNAQTCDRARIGGGTARIDARNPFPALKDLIPSKFSIFLSKPSRGAIASFTVVGAADERSPVVKREPVVAGVHAVLSASFFNDPSPDGTYGYKLVLPGNRVNGFDVSIAELHVTTTGLTLLKGTCLKRDRHGRCVKRQKRTLFWFTRPTCPPSGKISFEAFYDYAPPTDDVTKTIQLACPKFS